MNKTVKFRVSGKVQGVFFRVLARQEANSLGISGWIHNCADGAVEGMASGTAAQLDSFSSWLARGPDMARVQKLAIDTCDYQPFDAFEIR